MLSALAERMRPLTTMRRRPWVRSWKGPLPAIVTGWGVEHRSGADPYDWHGLKRGDTEFALVQYTIAGEGMLAYEGVTRRVTPGSAIVLTFPHDNRYWLPPGGSWEFFYVCMSGREVLGGLRDVIARAGPLIELPADARAVTRVANTCADMIEGKASSMYDLSARAYAITMALLDHTHPDAAIAPAASQLAKAVVYCREHLAEDIGVADLAAAAGYSRYHFTRLFKEAHGVTPNDFLVDLRVNTAAGMLRDTQATVKEVAKDCGFADPAYFCKVFRKAIGVSPGVFRDSGMYG